MKMLKAAESRLGAAHGTLFCMLCVVAVKGVGAVYKIPLFNKLGGYATGLYQMVFPVFSVMLVLSGSGVPLALTKLIACGYSERSVLKKSLLCFSCCGLFFTSVLFFFALPVARLQGDVRACSLYRAISPSIFLVSQIACFRGYYQGKCNLAPTALSQLIEQCVKCVIGLIAAYLLPVSEIEKAFFACVAVSLSELFALSYFLIKYGLSVKRERQSTALQIVEETGKDIKYGQIIACVLPLAFTALALPIAGIADSFIAINVLKRSFSNGATELYGLYGGAVETIIGLPSSVLMCFASGVLPKLSKNEQSGNSLLAVTAAASALCAAFVAFFPAFIADVLFKGLGNRELLIKMLRLSSVNIVALCCLQASNVVLLSFGRQSRSFISISAGVLFKILLDFLLIPIARINIYGLIISDFGCYFLALSLNIIYIYRVKTITKRERTDENNVDRIGRRLGRSVDKST